MEISTFLQHGAENAIPVPALCALTGLNPRALRQCIMTERAAGAEILYQPGGKGGYFLPSTAPEQAQRERAAFYKVQRARAMRSLGTLRPVARALGIPIGQLDMTGEGDTKSGGSE